MKPILFNTEMVLAILEGRKTVTRRPVKFGRGQNPKWSGYVPDGGVLYGSNNIPAKADRIIKERWGIEVEHIRAKRTYEERFYTVRTEKAKKRPGLIYGWPFSVTGAWCNSDVKMPPLKAIEKGGSIVYIGIAADEPNRFHNLTETKKSPLVEAGWTETDCRRWCEENDLLSPIYTTATRGGCWFCHNQGVGQLRLLRKNYPELWALMLKWDKDSPVTFHADGRTVHDYDRRFALEDEGLIAPDDKLFRWSMLDDELNYRWF